MLQQSSDSTERGCHLTMREVLQILREGVSSGVTGADIGATTNGKSWVDYGSSGIENKRRTKGGVVTTSM